MLAPILSFHFVFPTLAAPRSNPFSSTFFLYFSHSMPCRIHNHCVGSCRHRSRLTRLFGTGRISPASTRTLHPSRISPLSRSRFDFRPPMDFRWDSGLATPVAAMDDSSSTMSNYGSDTSSDPGTKQSVMFLAFLTIILRLASRAYPSLQLRGVT